MRDNIAGCGCWMLLTVLVSSAAIYAQTPPATAPADDKGSVQQRIDQAIRDLSAPEWRTREKAVKTLWTIGPLAGAKLMEAARSKDPEVAARANEILEKFAAGIYADTPKEVVPLLQQLRQGKLPLQQVVAKLREIGPAGYKTMAIIAPQELRVTLYDFLKDDKLDKARELLLAVCESGSDTALSDFVVVCVLTGQVDAEIERINNLPARSGLVEKCLAYLYRAKGDSKSALACARRSQDQDLLKALLIEQADWKALAEIEAAAPVPQGPNPEVATLDHLGHLAAYQRLAGNDKAAGEAVASLVQLAKTKPDLGGHVAKALLINERPSEALECLQAMMANPGLGAALLMQLGRADEAIGMLEKLRGRGLNEAQLNLMLARMNVQAGNRKRAWDLIGGQFQQVRYNPDSSRQFLLMEYRLGFQKETLDQIPQTAPWRGGKNADFSDILGPILGQPEQVIRTWYAQFRPPPDPKQPAWGEDPNARKYIESLMVLFNPQTPRKDIDAAIAKLEKTFAADQPPSTRATNFEAIGGLLLAHGRKQEAMKYYRQAASVVFAADQVEPAEISFGRLIQAGDLSAQFGKWEQAAADYALAYKAGPKDSPEPRQPVQPIRRFPGGQVPALPPITVQQTWIALYLQGAALVKAGKDEEGNKAIKRASLMLMGDAQARLELAAELAKRKFDDQSEAQLGLAARTAELGSPAWFNQWEESARRLSAKKDFAAAVVARQRLSLCCLSPGIDKVQFESYLLDAVRLRGEMMQAALAANKIDEAVMHAQKGTDLLPRNSDLLLDVIPALDKAGRKQQADKLFETAFKQELARVERAPESSTYHNAVAWLCARCRRQLDVGLEHGLKAVELEKNSPGVMDTLAEVYFQKGDRAKAVEIMTAALKLQPNWDYLQKQLARMKTGKPEDPVPEATEPP